MSEDKHIHIISLDVPYPADYGGAIDIYHRIVALHQLGFKIHLHCFEYGRGEQPHLKQFVEEVHYYPRKKSIRHILSRLPFIVVSRQSNELFQRLLQDNHPILFEGIHTTLLLNNPRLKERIKLVRMHNVEQDYYAALAKKSKGWKRLFYKREAEKLKRYEPVLSNAQHILAIQFNDKKHFERFHGSVYLFPACIPEITTSTLLPTKAYCLFHGNLSVEENSAAAFWLLDEVIGENKFEIHFVFAGKNPSDQLKNSCREKGVQLFENPSEDQMNQLIQEARVHVLYTDQTTGIKLKLVNSLNSSGHVLVNPLMVQGTDVTDLCSVYDSPASCLSSIQEAMKHPLDNALVEDRLSKLNVLFNSRENCKLIDRLI